MSKRALGFMPVVVILLVCVLVVPGFADENFGALVKDYGQGTVNWETGRIVANGYGHNDKNASEEDLGRQLAHRIAAGQARGNLLGVLKAVCLNNETTIGDFLNSNQEAFSSVSGFLQNTKQSETTYLSNGTIEVEDSISLRGEMAELVIPPSIQFASARPIASSNAESISMESMTENATGVILDARGLDLVPAMLPRVVDDSGYELYGPIYLTKDKVLRQGVVGYFVDMRKAQSTYRVGDNPMLIRVSSVTGAQNSDMVVLPEDAFRLKSLGTMTDILSQGRVLVVVGDPAQTEPVEQDLLQQQQQ